MVSSRSTLASRVEEALLDRNQRYGEFFDKKLRGWRWRAAKCRTDFSKADVCWRLAADPTPPTRNTFRWNSFIR